MPKERADVHARGDEPRDSRAALTSEGFSRQDEEFKQAADRSLQQRPTFSVRTRLLLAFSLFFLLPLAITIWTMNALQEIQQKILFLEVADDYEVEIQQARRFEKNFLLYGTNLADAREHAFNAQRLRDQHADRIRQVVGAETLQTMDEHFQKYLRLLGEMESLHGLHGADRRR